MHGAFQAIGILVDEVRILGDLTPAIFRRREIFDAVVLHRREQAIEPFGPGGPVGRGGDQNRNQLVQGSGNGRSQGARGRIDVLKRRPDPLHQRHHAIARGDRVGLGRGLDLGGSLLEPVDGKLGPAPAVGATAKLCLEPPVSARRHRFCTADRPGIDRHRMTCMRNANQSTKQISDAVRSRM